MLLVVVQHTYCMYRYAAALRFCALLSLLHYFPHKHMTRYRNMVHKNNTRARVAKNSR
jgi:hypothetical protein